MSPNLQVYQPHPISELLPLMSGAEFCELKADIKERGLKHPIVMYEGRILDGRNRFKACQEVGVAIETVQYVGDEPVSDVITENLKRRNLSSDQRACIAVEALPMLEKEAKERQVRTAENRNLVSQKIDPQESSTEAKKLKTKTKNANRSSEKAAKKLNTNRQYLSDAKKLKAEKPELFKKIKAGEIKLVQAKRVIKEEKRESIRHENREKISENTGEKTLVELGIKFSTIVIDPPWDWGDEGDKDQLGRAKPDYETLSLEELMELPIKSLSMPDAHIYLWVTNRSLPKGFGLLEKWGYRYITCLTWVKPSFGMGNYFRGQTEQVLFGVKGSQPLKRKDAATVFYAPRGENGHSSKPLEFYDLVESCSPGPYLELFSRNSRDDWSSWGENGNR